MAPLRETLGLQESHVQPCPDIFISQLCSMRGHYFLTTQFLGPFITQLGTGDAESSKMRLLPSSNTCLVGKMGMETNHLEHRAINTEMEMCPRASGV